MALSDKSKIKYEVAIIGGGPAGLMAAISAAQLGKRVVIIEKNPQVGRKLLLTGGGRCNLTNAEPETRIFIDNFGKAGKFLFSAFNQFSNLDVINFFKDLGIKLKVEDQNRVFPESNNAVNVLQALIDRALELDVLFLKNTEVEDIIFSNDKIDKIILNAGFLEADDYILATGGLTYPQIGSSSFGLEIAQKLGHTIIKPRPGLAAILIKDNFIKKMEGLSLENINLSLYNNKKFIKNSFGDLLFTYNSLSGPVALSLSREIDDSKNNFEVSLDFLPNIEIDYLENNLQAEFQKNAKKSLRNILNIFLPSRLVEVILEINQINPDLKAADVKKEIRSKIVNSIKDFRLQVKGVESFEKAMITCGGVALEEIDPKTMKSKIINNLYFAGEIINLDGPTGGYNLQLCWSTGYIAGLSN